MDSHRRCPPSGSFEKRARLVKTAVYYAAFIVLGLAGASFGPTLPGVANHVRSTIGQVSYLFVLRSLGYLTGSVLAGRLYDRVKGHPLMALVVFTMATTMFLVPVVPMLWLVGLILLILGIAEGLLDVGVNTLLVWVHRDEVAPFMNGLHFFFGLGAFLSPIIIAQAVLLSGDIYWAYWALAILMVPSALSLVRLPSPSPITADETAPALPAVPALIALMALFDFFYVGAEVAYGGWVFTYATALQLGTPITAALLTSGFWGALTAGRLISIPFGARFSPRNILLADLLVVLMGLGLILLFPASFAVLWAGTILIGGGMASIFPTILNLAGRHMTITGKVTSWFFVGASLGGMTLPWIVGQLFVPVGPQVVMLGVTVNTLLDLVLFFMIMLTVRNLPKKPG